MAEKIYGPVIAAIDAGHVTHGTRCVRCDKPSPCNAILTARKAQLRYAELLARHRAIAAGKLSNTGGLVRT